MAFDAAGTFTRYGGSTIWQGDAIAGTKILADRHDSHDQEIANGLSECLTRSGKGAPTVDISWGSKRLVNLGDPTADTDAANKKYVDNFKNFTTGSVITGADLNGRVTFSSPTGANGLSWTGADLAWLARLATVAGPGTPPVPPATLNRLVLNDKADGSGTDVVEVRDDGSIKAGAVDATSFTTTGTISAASLTTTGAVSAASLTTTGAVSAASLTTTGTITAADTVAGVNVQTGGVFGSTSGVIFLRPNGVANDAGRMHIDGGGNVSVMGGLTTAGQVTAGGPVTALNGGMGMANGGAGRIMQFASQWYWDWNGVNGWLSYMSPSGAFVTFSGNIQISGAAAIKQTAGQWVAASDARLKNIREAYTRGLAEIRAMPSPRHYSFKKTPDEEHIGYIAQEIEALFPECITHIEDEIDGQKVNDIRRFDPTTLLWAALNAIRELGDRLEAAEARIAALEAA